MIHHRLEDGQISAQENEPVEIRVPGQGATGYLWSIEADSERVQVLDHLLEPNSDTFGGIATESFVLLPMKKGKTRVRFALSAPWEASPADVRVIELEVLESL